MKFTDEELDAIQGALRVAAEAYDADARTMKQEGTPRLVEQFERQARQARALAGRIQVRS